MSNSNPVSPLKGAKLRNWLLKQTDEQRQQIWDSLSTREQSALLYDWEFWQREDQAEPEGNWDVWLLLSGRGSGKTRTGAEFIRKSVESGNYHHVALIGETVSDTSKVMIRGESGLLAVSPPWFQPVYKPNRRVVEWPNGAVGHTYSGDEPDQLRGPQHDLGWVDEIAKFRRPDDTWDNFVFGLRLGKNPRAIITTTPRPIKLIRDMLQDKGVIVNTVSTYANLANLSPKFIQRILKKYEGTRIGEQELYGQVLGDTPGALWRRDYFDIVNHVPVDLIRVVVGVDPSAGTAEDAAECGIIVAGLGSNYRCYVLDDVTVRGTPGEWGLEVIKAYHKYAADRIVAEVNNGGAMVEYVINTVAAIDSAEKQNSVQVNPHRVHPVSYKSVYASRAKHTRAEPIAALYERGIVSHLGYLDELETQCCVTGDTLVETQRGAIRIDSLVKGDKALTRQGYKPISWLAKTGINATVLRLVLSDGSSLIGTSTHPVFSVTANGFVALGNLKWQDVVITTTGEASVANVHQAESCDVYNIEVEDEHEYFANGVLVHNCTWIPGKGDSPDRMDALVWALTELYLEEEESEDYYVYEDRVTASPY